MSMSMPVEEWKVGCPPLEVQVLLVPLKNPKYPSEQYIIYKYIYTACLVLVFSDMYRIVLC